MATNNEYFGKPQTPEEKRDALKITDETVADYEAELERYKQGKQKIDSMIVANQEWWRNRHWGQMNTVENMEDEEKSTSAWLFNSIINKHADCMDNYPTTSVLPRSEIGEQEAKVLNQILPCISQRNNYEKVYSDKVYDLIIEGACITTTLWDNSLCDGFGDVVTRNIDALNFFWEPGVSDIQDSAKIFVGTLVDNDTLIQMYPQMEGHTGGGKTTQQYLNLDEQVDNSNKSEVWDMYYKVALTEQVAEDSITGQAVNRTREILHYVKFCNGVLLYASENDPDMAERGWYDHGRYPFTVTPLFKIKDSPWGFGYVDVMKSPQAMIDRLDQAIMKNALMSARPRWAIKEQADINADDFADWSLPFIKIGSSASVQDVLMDITAKPMPAFVVNHKAELIDQLKETSGNRDVAQGGTTGGATAATAIAAMQEAGSKLIRDLNKTLYRGTRDEAYLMVETMRQFYTEPREFRVEEEDGHYHFVQYISGLVEDGVKNNGVEFDINIIAEKQSPFSKAAQNEIIKEMYGMGLFAPENSQAALVCLEGMEFEGKEKIKGMVKENSVFLQQFTGAMNFIMSLAQMDPAIGMMAAQAGILAPPEEVAQQGEPDANMPETKVTDVTDGLQSDDTRTRNARLAAARHSIVK